MLISNYIKIAFRNLNRQKGYTLINIAGLTIGMACCLIMLVFIRHELSYDRFYADSDRIYRVAVEGFFSNDFINVASSPAPMAADLKNTFPQIQASVRLDNPNGSRLFNYKEKTFFETNYIYADSSFFDIFNLKLTRGSAKIALEEPFSMVITKHAATKYFGTDDPLGKIILIDDAHSYKITGIVNDIPDNTHLKFDFILSFASLISENPTFDFSNWGSLSFYTYIKLKPNANAEQLQEQLKTYLRTRMQIPDTSTNVDVKAFLQPIAGIHLYSNLHSEISENSSITYCYYFGTIALFILLIAFANFTNLTTARSLRRAKEIALRKSHGASKNQIIQQFLLETLIIALISLLLSFVIIELFMPYFNTLTSRHIRILDAGAMFLILTGGGLLIAATFLAGSYPAFYLSSFSPMLVMKEIARKRRKTTIRHILVLLQFTISIALIIATVIIFKQIELLKNKPLGFDKEDVVIIPMKNQRIRDNSLYIRDNLLQIAGVRTIAFSAGYPGNMLNGRGYIPEGKKNDDPMIIWTEYADEAYIPALNIQLIAGRNFYSGNNSDSDACIVNQAFVDKMGWQSPIGKRISESRQDTTLTFHIIGVVDNFHFKSLHSGVEPFILIKNMALRQFMLIKTIKNEKRRMLSQLEERWNLTEPSVPFEYTYLTDYLDGIYNSEYKLGLLGIYFTFVALLIACLGLFGLTSFSIQQSYREIGIRKVMGATITSLSVKLIIRYTRWVAIANVFAWPITYYLMGMWLQSFVFQYKIEFWVFILAALVVFLIAISTVLAQTLIATRINPINILKYE